MATANSTERYYWTTTCVLDTLINAAPKEAVIDAAQLLDGGNTAAYLLRGISYITALINNQPEDENNDATHRCAMSAIAEFTELVSRLVELDMEGRTYKLLSTAETH